MERWKEVGWLAGYRGVLEVSDAGRVKRRSYVYEAKGRYGQLMTIHKPDIVYATCLSGSGYPELAIQLAGKRRKMHVHILVARAFVPGYARHLCVNHINGVKTDNRAENLEWVTLSRNTEHQWEIGLVNLRGDSHPSRKLSSGKVRIIRDLLRLGATANSLAVLLEVSPSLIDKIRDGKRWADVA
jgi:hypothetical protein